MYEVSFQICRVDHHLEGRTIFANDLMDPGQNLVFIAAICNTTFEINENGETLEELHVTFNIDSDIEISEGVICSKCSLAHFEFLHRELTELSY